MSQPYEVPYVLRVLSTGRWAPVQSRDKPSHVGPTSCTTGTYGTGTVLYCRYLCTYGTTEVLGREDDNNNEANSDEGEGTTTRHTTESWIRILDLISLFY